MTFTYHWPEDRKARVKKVPRWEFEDRPAWCAGRPGHTYFSTNGYHYDTFEAALGHIVGYCRCARPLGHLGKCKVAAS